MIVEYIFLVVRTINKKEAWLITQIPADPAYRFRRAKVVFYQPNQKAMRAIRSLSSPSSHKNPEITGNKIRIQEFYLQKTVRYNIFFYTYFLQFVVNIVYNTYMLININGGN